MWKPVMACGLAWVMASGWALQARAVPAQATPAGGVAARATLDQYCVTCHNQRAKIGGLALDNLDVAAPAAAADTWERVIRRLSARSMPPHGVARPDEAAYDRLSSWLEGELDRAAAAAPDPGRLLVRRLNRSEYANAIRDLLDLQVDAAALLPPDDAAFGFDNNADLLGVSPALIERYVIAADRVSALAVGAATGPGSHTYRVRQDRSQDQHIEGLPLGTVGGLAATHTFPVDGEYRLSLELFRTNLEAIRGLEHPHQIEISIDGRQVFIDTIGGPRDQGGPAAGAVTDRMDAIDARLQVQVPITAGPHVVGAAFIHKIGAGTSRLRPFLRSSAGTYDSTGRPHIETLTVAGPFNAAGSGDTASRRRIFTCGSTAATASGTPSPAADERCAREILTRLARLGFRRAVTPEDMAVLMPFYQSARARGGFEAGIQMALRRILASPSFVFRIEESRAGAAAGVVRVSDTELASRLSFFLWSSIPDEALLDAAARGELRGEGLERQVRRMLADPRAGSLVRNFAGQWLHVRNLSTITPNHDLFPDFDDTLRDAFRREMELFVAEVLTPSTSERSVLDLLTADFTYVNERLAKHYGIPHVYGSHFRRVTVADDARRGLLGKGSLLMVTSHADRTAPVLRGKWILENLLGTPPQPPPANFALADDEPGDAPKTIRERMERHRASPACAGCHRVMDPLGFALENFDAVGAWRERDGRLPIDASGELTDGAKVDGVVALRRALVARPEVFLRTFTEKLLIYGLGRGLAAHDMPAVRGIVRDAGRRDHVFSELVLGVVRSAPFQMRRN
jgi:mono/diheme cytochrome c family protein